MISAMIKAVIYDLDGTLLDTVDDIAAAHNHALGELGLPTRPVEDFNNIIGGGILQAIALAAPEGASQETILRLNEIYQRYYPANCTDYTMPYPGMIETVNRFADMGVMQAVFTNKTEATAIKMTEHFFGDYAFRFIWGNDGVRPLKPAPDAGLEICRELDLLPEEVAYIGDSGTDMLFAASVGMLPVGACWGYRSRQELLEAGAKYLPETPEEMANTLVPLCE